MKMRKITSLILAGVMAISIAACNMLPGLRPNKDDDDDRETRIEESETEKETTKETTTEETTKEETTTEASSEETTTGIPDADTETTQAQSGGTSGKVLDFDDMHFYINGKKYTMGQTTLQELIDDGVPFRKSDLSKINQSVKKNGRQLTGGFNIELDKYWTAQVYIMNATTSEKPAKDCVIWRINLPLIDKNYENKANLTFDFPFTMTMADLTASAGEPEEGNKKHYDGSNYHTDTYTYKSKAKRFSLYNRVYTFEFKNDVLSKVEMDYLP